MGMCMKNGIQINYYILLDFEPPNSRVSVSDMFSPIPIYTPKDNSNSFWIQFDLNHLGEVSVSNLHGCEEEKIYSFVDACW
ncbi:MAG: hypothetical protein Ta2E_09840 [Mycoplasmoidaceae bacterium]|nr:MAG: hypothetical protein Ta2E_09840 [Mycoplasmoidaceae bacterium]